VDRIFQDAGLKGTLPDSLGNLTAIEDMYGTFSSRFFLWVLLIAALRLRLLKGNGLSGTIPASLGKLKSLIRLCVSMSSHSIKCVFQWAFPSFPSSPHRQLFDNQLTGSIPPELGNLTNIGSLYSLPSVSISMYIRF